MNSGTATVTDPITRIVTEGNKLTVRQQNRAIEKAEIMGALRGAVRSHSHHMQSLAPQSSSLPKLASLADCCST